MESLGKETNVLDPDEHFYVIVVLLRIGMIWGYRFDTGAAMEKNIY